MTGYHSDRIEVNRALLLSFLLPTVLARSPRGHHELPRVRIDNRVNVEWKELR